MPFSLESPRSSGWVWLEWDAGRAVVLAVETVMGTLTQIGISNLNTGQCQ